MNTTGESVIRVTRPALSDIHRAYLNDHAITDEVIREKMIYSDGGWIVFPWVDAEAGQATMQDRHWPPFENEIVKYRWDRGRPGTPVHFAAWRPAKAPGEGTEPGPVIISEGTKQSLAVASWAPAEYAVYGMSGCWNWRNKGELGTSLHRLDRFAGRKVIVMMDADAADNLDVYEAAEALGAELGMEDAAEVLYTRLPAQGKDGIDDYLAGITPTRRQERLARLLAAAVPKPADRKPVKRKISEEVPDPGQGREMVIINNDRLQVINSILGHMKAKFAQQLFSYGGAITRLRGSTTEPLDKDSLLRWMAEAVATYRYKPPGQASPGVYDPCWPEPQTIGAILASGDDFPELSRISRSPLVRPDGSICAKNGYDYDPVTGYGTRTMLIMGNSGMDRLDIPHEPSQAQAAVAASYLAHEWLGDMPFRDEASRAGALALALTPFIRGLVPLVPLAVISGLQMGVGKNLLADCLSIMITGDSVQTMPWVTDDDDENRKQILSAFRAGTTLLCLDEAHEIKSTALARAITSVTYADRILGISKMASYPNTVTWLALGNQVQVDGDMSRRYYPVELYPEGPDPQDRDESSFTHPDLRGWTRENRPELVTAILTLIRAWYAAGEPLHPRGALMGSFEPWDKTVSGILGHARVPGFLANLASRRAERDDRSGFWSEHLTWLAGQFGSGSFIAADVQAKAMASGGNWEPPPRPADPAMLGFTRELGKEYAKNSDRWYGRHQLVREGLGHASTVRWRVHTQGEDLIPPIHPIPPAAQAGSYPSGSTSPDLGGRDGMDHFPDARNVQGHTPLASTIGGVASEHTLPDQAVSQDGGMPVQTPMPTRPAETPLSGGNGGNGGIPTPFPYARAGVRVYAHTHTREGVGVPAVTADPSRPAIGFDLETADADDIFRTERGYVAEDGAGFVRLAGVVGPAGNRQIVPVQTLLRIMGAAGRLDGHNILGFDGLALAQHHGMDWWEFAAKARDSELIARQVNPPRSRESGSSEDKYDLDHVAAGLGVAGKTDDLARLARVHGGYGKIPLDDAEYRSYLFGDLGATRAVSDGLNPYYDADPYLAREHELAAIAGQMTLNGFAVDRELLAERAEQTSHRKADALRVLNSGWGLPLSKTVMRGRGSSRHEVDEPMESPLAADIGRDWLASMWERYQVPDPPLTDTGKLAIGGDDLRRISSDPRCPAELKTMLGLMGIVTASRTVYQTAADWLCPDGRVHPKISMRQASGRWSVTKPGLTVFGKRGGKHVERQIFLPDPGHVLLSFDLSQVDMRAMAGHSQDPAYMDMFGFEADGKPKDAHKWIAMQVGLDRQDAKVISHGWNYGLGAKSMIRDGLDPEKVWRFINGMEARFPRLIGWREEIRAQGRAGMILDNGFGRRMRCEPSRAYTVAPALMGQGGARDVMCECLLRLPAWVYPFLRAMVHDEIVMSVPLEAVQDVIRVVTGAMTWEWAPPGKPATVPILCDMTGPGANWAEISNK